MHAAMEGRFLGLPAIAVSLVFDEKPNFCYDTAAEGVVRIIDLVTEGYTLVKP